jgi:hypothetical protein
MIVRTGMVSISGKVHREQPGRLVLGTPAPVGQVAGPTGHPTTVESANPYVPGRCRATVPAENFLAWNALRLIEFALLILKTHVPDGPTLVPVLHACLPALRLPALRCAGCAGSSAWPCPHVDWAREWIGHLPGIVEAAERRNGFADGVSTPVVVGDVQVPAASWDTLSRRREVS